MSETGVEQPKAAKDHIKLAIKPRAALLLLGVLFIQLAFILSYIGAFHNPTPHQIPMGVVAPDGAPAGTAQQVADDFNQIHQDPIDARVVDDVDAAHEQIRNRTLAGALVLGDDESAKLLVASAEGGALAEALEDVVQAAASDEGLTVEVDDFVPAGDSDRNGITSFFLALGWVIGGYMGASALTISLGTLPPTVPRVLIRLASIVPYAVASGIVGVLIADQWLGALSGNFWAMAGFGSLIVFAIGAFTMALQALTGIVGIGIVMLLFVVLGSPSAGGAYPGPLLPTFWRDIGPYLPPGAGTSGLRSIVYFDGAQVLTPILVICGYLVVGVAVLVIAAAIRAHRAHAAGAPRHSTAQRMTAAEIASARSTTGSDTVAEQGTGEARRDDGVRARQQAGTDGEPVAERSSQPRS